MNTGGVEIERKFLIQYPDAALLNSIQKGCSIEQTYLLPTKQFPSRRVRKCSYSDGTIEYVYTEKQPVSEICRIENERAISEHEYNLLLCHSDKTRNSIIKTRYYLCDSHHVFELDVYPFWKDRAIMEIELKDENDKYDIPDSIKVIKDVTSDKRYSNKSLAKEVITEPLL